MRIHMDNLNGKGWIKLPRYLIKNLFDEALTINEYSLLTILAANADWDKRHKAYSTLTMTNTFLGTLKGFDRNKVALVKKGLIAKGFISTETIHGAEVITILEFNNFQVSRVSKVKPEEEIDMDELEKLMGDETNA